MISIWWLVPIALLSASFGVIIAGVCSMVKRSDEHIKLLAQQMREDVTNEDKP